MKRSSAEVARQRVVQMVQDRARRRVPDRERAQHVLHHRRLGRGLGPLARDVSHDEADLAVRQVDHVVEVAADIGLGVGRLVDRPDSRPSTGRASRSSATPPAGCERRCAGVRSGGRSREPARPVVARTLSASLSSDPGELRVLDERPSSAPMNGVVADVSGVTSAETSDSSPNSAPRSLHDHRPALRRAAPSGIL